MTTPVSEQARELLATVCQIAGAASYARTVREATGYVKIPLHFALRAIEKALAQRPTLSPRDEVKKRVLYIEFDGERPTAAVYKEDGREIMRCSIDLAPKLNEGVIAEVKETVARVIQSRGRGDTSEYNSGFDAGLRAAETVALQMIERVLRRSIEGGGK